MSDLGIEQRGSSPDTIYIEQNQLFGLYPQYEFAKLKSIKMGQSSHAIPFKVIPLLVEGLTPGQILIWPHEGSAPPPCQFV